MPIGCHSGKVNWLGRLGVWAPWSVLVGRGSLFVGHFSGRSWVTFRRSFGGAGAGGAGGAGAGGACGAGAGAGAGVGGAGAGAGALRGRRGRRRMTGCSKGVVRKLVLYGGGGGGEG